MVLCSNSALAPSLPCLKNGYAKRTRYTASSLCGLCSPGDWECGRYLEGLPGPWQDNGKLLPLLCTQAGFRVAEDRPGEELRISCLFALCAGFCFLDLTSCCFPERPRFQDRIHPHHPSASMEASPRSAPRAHQCPSEPASSGYHLSGKTSCSAPSHTPTHRQEAQVVCVICHLPAQVLTPTLDLHRGPGLPFMLCTWDSLHLLP